MGEVDSTRYGLARRVYAAAHDVEPHQVDETDGGYEDVAHLIGERECQDNQNLAEHLGMDVTEVEDWQLVDAILLLRWLHAEAAFERDQLGYEIMGYQAPGGEYDKGYEHGSALAAQYKQAFDSLRDALRDAHHIPYVDEDHQGGNCADIVLGLIGRAVRAERELSQVEASRRDWAAEAVRLQHFLETKMFPGVFGAADPPISPTVCACISNDQAASLSPGFSRPVCAVHPERPADEQLCSGPAWEGHGHHGLDSLDATCPYCPDPAEDAAPCGDEFEGRACRLVPGHLTLHSDFAAEWSGTPWAEGGEPA